MSGQYSTALRILYNIRNGRAFKSYEWLRADKMIDRFKRYYQQELAEEFKEISS